MIARVLTSFGLLTLIACASTSADETGTSEGAATAGVCQTADDAEDNHSPATATRTWDSGDNNIADPNDNSSSLDYDSDAKSRSVSEGAPDWYRITFHDWNSGPMRQLKPAAFALSAPHSRYTAPTVRVCFFMQADHSFACDTGQPAEAEGMKGCCGTTQPTDSFQESVVSVDLENPLIDDTQDVFMRVEAVAPGCQSYQFGYKGSN